MRGFPFFTPMIFRAISHLQPAPRLRLGRPPSLPAPRFLRFLLPTFYFLLAAAFFPSTASAYERQNSGIWESALAERAFDTGPSWFSAGPAWLMNAMPGAHVSAAGARYLIDRSGDREESTAEYNGYVGTLHDVFNVSLFNNIATFGVASTSKTATPFAPDATLATDLFWNTNGVSNTWTSTNWGTTSAGPFTTAWTADKNTEFTAASSVTFATTSIGDVKVDDGVTVTVTAGGTLSTNGAVRTFDIGTGSLLTWTGQAVSNNSTSGFIKNGAGTWNIGSQANNYTGGFTLNAGTVIVTGNRSFGTAAMTINGGIIQSSTGITFAPTSLTIGGNFAFSGTGNDIWGMTVNTGSSNRTITNNTTSTATRTFSNTISGSGGITFDGTGGSGGIVLSGANDYTGGTILSGGLLKLSGSGTLGSTSGTLNVNGGTLDLGGTNQTVGALNGSAGAINTSTGTSTLTVGNGDGSGSYAGSITNTGTVALTKTGAGTQTLTANDSYTGATTINGGVLELKNSGGVTLSGTSGVAVNNGGTLLMSANNQINQATFPGISIGSAAGSGTAKIDAGGFSQGTGGTPVVPNSGTIGLGALTMNASSVIDLTGTSVLHFSDSSGQTWTGTLFIWDWSGTATTGGGSEQILFGGTVNGLTAGQLLQVSFYSDNGSTLISNTGLILADGEIIPGPMTPVPEPSTWSAAALAFFVVGYIQRKRFAKRLRVTG